MVLDHYILAKTGQLVDEVMKPSLLKQAYGGNLLIFGAE